MNIAVIIAGGSGHRMGQDIPKQFIKEVIYEIKYGTRCANYSIIKRFAISLLTSVEILWLFMVSCFSIYVFIWELYNVSENSICG